MNDLLLIVDHENLYLLTISNGKRPCLSVVKRSHCEWFDVDENF